MLSLPPAATFRDWVTTFQNRYPAIKLEITQQNGSDFVSRLVPERRSDKYLWDVYVGGAETGYGGLKNGGLLDPFSTISLAPDLLDDTRWLGGFQAGFVDQEGQYVYKISGDVVPTAYVERSVIPEDQLSRVEQLTDSMWQGQMSLFDPRVSGNGAADGGHWLMVAGSDWWRRLLAQQPATTQDRRQQIEWLVRGPYRIAIGGSNTELPIFQRQGLGVNVKPLAFASDMGRRVSQSYGAALINRRPHPNAATLFVNWLLSSEGQGSFVKATGQNSRRLDVPKGDPATAADPAAKYFPSVNAEVSGHFVREAQQIAKEVLK